MTTQLWATQVWLFAKVMGAYERVAGPGGSRSERGTMSTQYAILVAVGAALAIAVTTTVVAIVMTKVGSINLDTPTP